MFRRILDLFRRAGPKRHRVIPSSPEIPELWSGADASPRLGVLDDAKTRVLTALCDDYWDSFFAVNDDELFIRNSDVHRRALQIIVQRGNEAISWARQRLSHPNYEAREDSAALIAEWAENEMLGSEKADIAKELAILAVTRPKEDTKEAQAASVALRALSCIGGPQLMTAVRQVLTSNDWNEDDNQWECAEILAGITNEPFMHAKDPVMAAKMWLQAHPESGGTH